MAVLSKDEFFANIQKHVGDDTSDDAIAFMEDMTDTYNDLEKRAAGDGVNWEQKYKDLDESWKKRYRHRFFSGDGGTPNTRECENADEGTTPENIQFSDLFKGE